MNPDFRLPEHWTPEQADAFLDIVEMLHDAVFNQYGDELTKLWMNRPPGESFWNDVDDLDEDLADDDPLYEPLP
jgi:hypothetical protein